MSHIKFKDSKVDMDLDDEKMAIKPSEFLKLNKTKYLEGMEKLCNKKE